MSTYSSNAQAGPSEAEVLTERHGSVLLVTINRPTQRNAVNSAVAEGIAAAMELLDGDATLAVAVLTGAGGTFCAGMDLKAFVAGETPVVGNRGFAGLVKQPPAKPLIGAVEGFALAGGLEIALACDLIVVGDGARFGIPEVKRGLVAAGGALLRLPRKLPRAVATELALTGDPIAADRAYALGMINRVVPDGTAVSAALDLGGEITRNGPLAVAATKRIRTESVDWPEAEFWERQDVISRPVFASADAREGAQAFAERRDPVWQCR